MKTSGIELIITMSVITLLIVGCVIAVDYVSYSLDSKYENSSIVTSPYAWGGNVSPQFHTYDNDFKLSIVSDDFNFTNTTIRINTTHIINISYKNDIMIIKIN